MPNWCNNVVEIAHKDPAKLKEVVDAFNRGEFCQYAIPVPEDLKIVAGCVSDELEQKKLEEDTARNVEKYGYGNWYDFCVSEWGTKWDVGGDSALENEIELKEGQTDTTLSFDSAWSPPTGVYDKLIEMGFEVRAYYYESGMAYCGVYDDGFDDYFEFGDMSWEQVRDEIPEALDEMFCISENMEMWAEENQEIELNDGIDSINE